MFMICANAAGARTVGGAASANTTENAASASTVGKAAFANETVRLRVLALRHANTVCTLATRSTGCIIIMRCKPSKATCYGEALQQQGSDE